MMNKLEKRIYHSVDEYIESFPALHKAKLEALRSIVKEEVPGADEVISYNMPAFKYKGILCYYAAHREHVGFYPASAAAIANFLNDLQGFAISKGTVRLPLDKDIPEEIIRKMIRYRLHEKLIREKKR